MDEFICPECNSVIGHSKRRGIVTFFCEFCGFSYQSQPGYRPEEAYVLLLKSKNITFAKVSSEPRSRGFKTKQKSNAKFHYKSKKLKLDPIIESNYLKVQQNLPQNIPDDVFAILKDKSYKPVFYEKLPEIPPEEVVDVDEKIVLNGIKNVLHKRGISRLFDFQNEAYDRILNNENVIITAPTGLGKTEAFLLPILESSILTNPNPFTRKRPIAILIYPTKALARDQLLKIQEYCSPIGLQVKIFDGDTPRSARDELYDNPPDILITNPDMINLHLRVNYSFQGLIANVKFVVIDEIHLCTGSYGSNILWILRRMRRFISNFQCIGASATISRAQEFAETIFDVPTTLISAKNARKSPMHLVMIYPEDTSNLSAMARVIQHLATSRKKTLAFGNSHLTTEALNLILQRNGIAADIHRAGLTAKHRNSVEENFKKNKLQALVATPTLELGIDIGNLDAVVTMLTGLTSFVQRIGRAGRKGQESIASLVLRGDDPISAYYARSPDEYLSEIAPAFVEPNNELVAEMQLLAMAYEKPLSDAEYGKYQRHIDKLIEDKLLYYGQDSIVVKNRSRVGEVLYNYSIRGIGDNVKILNRSSVIGERGLPMALGELHPGALYLHGGRSYRVQSYDDKSRVARVSNVANKGEKTQAERSIWPTVDEVLYEKTVNGIATAYLSLELTETVSGYGVYDIFTNQKTARYDLPTPLTYTYKTKGFAVQLPEPEHRMRNKKSDDLEKILGGTYHAIEHVLIESGNGLTGGGANQIGGISLGTTGLVFVYDGAPGGSGLSKLLFDKLETGLSRSLKIMKDCPCNRVDGCPRCTYSYQCGNNNEPLDRLGAIDSLEQIGGLSTELSLDYDGADTFIAHPDYSSIIFQ